MERTTTDVEHADASSGPNIQINPPKVSNTLPSNPRLTNKLALLTNSHLNLQRANAATQIFSSTIPGVSLIVNIPIKLAQFILSGQTIFNNAHIKPIEAIAHALQALLAFAQLTLFTIMFFKGEECTQTDELLCKLVEILNAFYQGMLLVGWVPSEFSKNNKLSEEALNSAEDQPDQQDPSDGQLSLSANPR